MNDEFKIIHEEETLDSNGYRIKKCIYKHNRKGVLSSIKKYDNDNIYIEGKYYTDKNFTDLFYTKTKEYNEDNSITEKWIYEKNYKGGYLSKISYYDSTEKLINCFAYTKNRFEKFGTNYLPNG